MDNFETHSLKEQRNTFIHRDSRLDTSEGRATQTKSHQKMNSYKSLIPMLVSHFVIMFAVMYSMVDKWSDVFINLNQFYMTMMMVLPMTIGMLLFMKSM